MEEKEKTAMDLINELPANHLHVVADCLTYAAKLIGADFGADRDKLVSLANVFRLAGFEKEGQK